MKRNNLVSTVEHQKKKQFDSWARDKIGTIPFQETISLSSTGILDFYDKSLVFGKETIMPAILMSFTFILFAG